MFSCCCSSPDCQVKGCVISRQQRQQYAQPHPFGLGQAPSLTPEDIRRIVREELERAGKAPQA